MRSPHGTFDEQTVPTAPNYANPASWAALPDRFDTADSIVEAVYRVKTVPEVDVFFVHPTQYPQHNRKDRMWVGPIDDPKLNGRIDGFSMLYQASTFNAAGKVYAPRYRQMHYAAYFGEDTASYAAALDFAYRDVRAAFEYYLAHYNAGRPIIIAAHSQGTQHAARLLQEFFDGKPLQDRLVAAYLAGMPIRKTDFKSIPVCESPEQTGCFCSWRTFQRGYMPPHIPTGPDIAVTNPITWRTDTTYADTRLHSSAVLPSLTYYEHLCDAQCHEGILWTTKPSFRGSIFIYSKNFHVGDYNLFYGNVRDNARLRAERFLAK